MDVQQKDKLLTVDEAAEMLSLAVPTVYKLVNQNKIPFMKRTKRLYFSIDSYTCQNEFILMHIGLASKRLVLFQRHKFRGISS